ncbi:MAG: hypothetical protein VX908_07960 [Planctomycetota bacterium]|nr:hypothetical protein [Planctomycetota bacterium]
MNPDSSNPFLQGIDGPEPLSGRTVVSHVPCAGCSYELRGLHADSSCPECGRLVRESLARWIDPEVHRHPTIANPRMVATGLHWFTLMLCISFLSWVVGMAFSHAPFGWFDVPSTPPCPSCWPAWVRGTVQIGNWLLVASTVLAFLSIPALAALAPLRRSQRRKQAWRIITMLGTGLILWACAMLLQFYIEPGYSLFDLARETSDLGQGGQWSTRDLIVTCSPLPGGWLLLLGIRSLMSELGHRSRTFRTSTTKRQYVLDVVWATFFWASGAALQYVGGGMGIPLPVTFGMILRLISGAFIIVGVLYLVMNLTWIAKAMGAPPPRLRSLLSEVSDSQ